jgi:hypothetical protein
MRLLRTAQLLAAACLFAPLIFLPQTLSSQRSSAPETELSCRKFVQAFYDWYLKKTLSGKLAAPTPELALKLKPELFSIELRRRLKQDLDAQSKAEEIVGLDSDPFLNSQDPSPRFAVVGITRKGSNYWVDVYGILGSKRQEHVIPELIQQNGHWIFVNFHYGKSKWSDDENLLTILKNLRAERQKNPQ